MLVPTYETKLHTILNQENDNVTSSPINQIDLTRRLEGLFIFIYTNSIFKIYKRLFINHVPTVI